MICSAGRTVGCCKQRGAIVKLLGEVRTQTGGNVDLQDGAAVAKRISRWETLEDSGIIGHLSLSS